MNPAAECFLARDFDSHVMRLLLLLSRLLLIIVFSAIYLIFWRIARLFAANSPARHKRWRFWTTRTWSSGIARIVGIRVVIAGSIPKPPFFLVANHLSYSDIICLATCLDCVFIAKSDIKNWPGVGALASSVDTIFVNREHFQDMRRVLTLTEDALAAGYGIVLFPEGTSTKGDKVHRFHPSLLEPAVRLNLPVSYASLRYETPATEKPAFLSVCWWGDMAFVPHFLELLKLPRIDAQITFGATQITASDRKTMALKLQEAVSMIFVPVITSEEEELYYRSDGQRVPAES